MYTIDLTTILRILAHQSGELQTEVKNVAGSRGRGQVCIMLLEGKVTSCSITVNGSVVLAGDAALRVLQGMGKLEWKYIAQTYRPVVPPPAIAERPPRVSSDTMPAIPPYTDTVQVSGARSLMLYPVRIRFIEQHILQTQPRDVRAIYSLADGSRSVGEILQVLGLPYERVIEVLVMLQEHGIITLSAQQQSNPGGY